MRLPLPRGCRFDPNESELLQYLSDKAAGRPDPGQGLINDDVDVYGTSPDLLPVDLMASGGDGRLFCFTPIKFRKGSSCRVRSTPDGHWKSTNGRSSIKDEEGKPIGFTQTFIYYSGKKEKEKAKRSTNKWIMKEYTLLADPQNVALCVIYSTLNKFNKPNQAGDSLVKPMIPNKSSLSCDASSSSKDDGSNLQPPCLPDNRCPDRVMSSDLTRERADFMCDGPIRPGLVGNNRTYVLKLKLKAIAICLNSCRRKSFLKPNQAGDSFLKPIPKESSLSCDTSSKDDGLNLKSPLGLPVPTDQISMSYSSDGGGCSGPVISTIGTDNGFMDDSLVPSFNAEDLCPPDNGWPDRVNVPLWQRSPSFNTEDLRLWLDYLCQQGLQSFNNVEHHEERADFPNGGPIRLGLVRNTKPYVLILKFKAVAICLHSLSLQRKRKILAPFDLI